MKRFQIQNKHILPFFADNLNSFDDNLNSHNSAVDAQKKGFPPRSLQDCILWFCIFSLWFLYLYIFCICVFLLTPRSLQNCPHLCISGYCVAAFKLHFNFTAKLFGQVCSWINFIKTIAADRSVNLTLMLWQYASKERIK